MEKLHTTTKIRKALMAMGATLALGGVLAVASPVEAHASEWDEREVTEIQTDIQGTDSLEYEIQWGDTLGNIAQAVGIPLSELANANGIGNIHYIIAGQTLVISEDALGQTHVEVQEVAPAPVQEVAPAPVQEVAPEPVQEVAPAPVQEVAPAPVQETQSSNLSTSEAEAKEIIAQKESSGSYTAVNGQYYGRYQLNPSLVQHGASPAEQEIAADKYVSSRYGSWSKALEHHRNNNWY